MPTANTGEMKKVVLLHGLARTRRSMGRMEQALQKAGYDTRNIGYPSTRLAIRDLVRQHVLPEIQAWAGPLSGPVHFVTHSMGGILVRVMAGEDRGFPIGRVVMLSPPNQGSEVVDILKGQWWFRMLNGPAGQELGTDPASLPNRLGPAAFETGIITGNRSVNWILSAMIPGGNDGKVSVRRAKLPGMQDFRVVPVAHPFVMRNRSVIRHTLHFLARGSFPFPDGPPEP